MLEKTPDVSVTCPACATAQDIPAGTPTGCLVCEARLDVVPGKYMRVIPRNAVASHAGSGTLKGLAVAETGQRSSSEQRGTAGSSTLRR